MPYVVLGVLGAVAVVAFATSLYTTIQRYRDLPADVPDHFNVYGWPDAFGPRPMIFATVFAQAIAIAVWLAVILDLRHKSGGLPGFISAGIFVDAVLIAMTRLQQGILKVAEGRAERIEHVLWPLLLIAAGVAISFAAGAIWR